MNNGLTSNKRWFLRTSKSHRKNKRLRKGRVYHPTQTTMKAMRKMVMVVTIARMKWLLLETLLQGSIGGREVSLHPIKTKIKSFQSKSQN